MRFRVLQCLTATLLAAPLLSTGVAAATFVLNDTTDRRDLAPGDGVCLSPAGTCTLRAAIQEANALPGTDTVQVPAGTYTLTLGNGDDQAERGDFDVLETLIVSGTGSGASIIDANRQDRIFDVHKGAGLQLSAITLRNGAPNNDGGAIRSEASLTLNEVVLSNNEGKDGGAVKVDEQGVIVSLDNVRFVDNIADKGAGLYAKKASVTVTRAVFTNNIAAKDGGGIYFDDVSATLDNTVLENNRAEKGAGVFVKKSVLAAFSRVTALSNQASKEGGALYADDTRVDIRLSVFANGSAKDGGGLFTKGNTELDMVNTTISGNMATREGGGLQKEDNRPARLVNVTVYDNAAPVGAGIYARGDNLSVSNTLIAMNNQGADCSGAILSLGHNLDSDGSCQLNQAGDLPAIDPLAGPLQDNGGGTLTHALLQTSPARDAGNNTGCPAVDQRGSPRPVDGNGDGQADCDIGAYEAEPLYPDYALHKNVSVLSDPYSGSVNPKAIPGSVLEYFLRLSNHGPGAAQLDTLAVVEAIPAGTALLVVDFDAANAGPVAFIDSMPPSGLSYDFDSLGSNLDDIEFSSDGGLTFTYTPVPDTDGADTAVTHMRIRPAGTARYSGADPVATFVFKVMVL